MSTNAGAQILPKPPNGFDVPEARVKDGLLASPVLKYNAID